jgi:hypothetical protein
LEIFLSRILFLEGGDNMPGISGTWLLIICIACLFALGIIVSGSGKNYTKKR